MNAVVPMMSIKTTTAASTPTTTDRVASDDASVKTVVYVKTVAVDVVAFVVVSAGRLAPELAIGKSIFSYIDRGGVGNYYTI